MGNIKLVILRLKNTFLHITLEKKIFNCIIILYLLQPFSLPAQYILRGQVLDKVSKEELIYATVYFKNFSTVTNEDGNFLLKANEPITWVGISYVSYKPDTIQVDTSGKFINIQLVPSLKSLNAVTVFAKTNDDRYKLFYEAIESFHIRGGKKIQSKAFFRSYTTVDSVNPAELFESYYNLKCSSLGVYDSKLKAGRFLLPKQTSFLNMSSISLITIFNPFINNEAVFPYAPFASESWRQLKRNYIISIKDRTPYPNDTLVQFEFKARDSINTFSGVLFYWIKAKCPEKVILFGNNVTAIPFYSIADSANHKFTNLKYHIEMGYNSFKSNIVFHYIDFNMEFDLKGKDELNKHIYTSMKLLLYDYEKEFQLPVFRSITTKTDYQQITYFPYNDYFFIRNPVIEENAHEKNLRKTFDTISCYDSRKPNESIPFIPNRIEEWSETWSPNLKLVGTKPNNISRGRLKKYETDIQKPTWDSSFASTMLYLDYDCYPDTIVFNSTALIDYKYSYILKADSITEGYFRMYLDVAKLAAQKMLFSARKTYAHKCPSEEEITKLYDYYNNSYEQDMYNLYCNSNSTRRKMFYPKLKKIISEELQKFMDP